MSRRYVATQHVRQRLAERYGIALTDEAWDTLAQEIEQWPWRVVDQPRPGTEAREAQVRLEGPSGEALIVPFVYVSGRHQCSILTVHSGGLRIPRPRAG